MKKYVDLDVNNDIFYVSGPLRKIYPNYIFKKMDVRDLVLSDLKDIDYVFHLAFVTNIPNSIKNPLDTTFDNIDMTAYLLKLATESNKIKFLFLQELDQECQKVTSLLQHGLKPFLAKV